MLVGRISKCPMLWVCPFSLWIKWCFLSWPIQSCRLLNFWYLGPWTIWHILLHITFVLATALQSEMLQLHTMLVQASGNEGLEVSQVLDCRNKRKFIPWNLKTFFFLCIWHASLFLDQLTMSARAYSQHSVSVVIQGCFIGYQHYGLSFFWRSHYVWIFLRIFIFFWNNGMIYGKC